MNEPEPTPRGLAIAGESGPERVFMPKEPLHVHLYLDGKELARETMYHYFPSPISPDKDRGTQIPTVPGWQDYDYQDYRDIEAAISADKELSYAQCTWLLRQGDNEAALDAVFPEDKWLTWYVYAVGHCLKFRRERPKR